MKKHFNLIISFLILLVVATSATYGQQPIPVKLPPPKPGGTAKPGDGPQAGDKMIDIKFKNETGVITGLSDLSGKMALLVFWNSECDHCVVENEDFRDIRLNYKDRKFVNGNGFDIFSISFDKDKEIWKKSVESNQFTWKHQHHFLSTTTMKELYGYKVSNLPGTFLIDGTGTIVERDFHGRELEERLKKYLAE